MSKPHLRLRLVKESRPLRPLTLAEKRAAVARDFKANPWMRGEGAQFYTAERVAQIAAENEQRRKAKRK